MVQNYELDFSILPTEEYFVYHSWKVVVTRIYTYNQGNGLNGVTLKLKRSHQLFLMNEEMLNWMKILSYVPFRFIATITRINGRRHIRIAVVYQTLKTNMNLTYFNVYGLLAKMSLSRWVITTDITSVWYKMQATLPFPSKYQTRMELTGVTIVLVRTLARIVQM